jgi:hypothetical protein
MTRVLVVNHDLDVGDIEADELRRAGYEVDQCEGPVWAGSCPVMNGEPCWQVERADVLVYDDWMLPDGRDDLVDDLRTIHPDKPIVLGPRGVRTRPRPDARTALVTAIEEAVAHPLTSTVGAPKATPFPRW